MNNDNKVKCCKCGKEMDIGKDNPREFNGKVFCPPCCQEAIEEEQEKQYGYCDKHGEKYYKSRSCSKCIEEAERLNPLNYRRWFSWNSRINWISLLFLKEK